MKQDYTQHYVSMAWECNGCGALVLDKEYHDLHHYKMNEWYAEWRADKLRFRKQTSF